MVLFLTENPCKNFFHSVILKHFWDGEFQLLDLLKYLAKVWLDWKMGQFPGPKADGFYAQIDQFPRILLIII